MLKYYNKLRKDKTLRRFILYNLLPKTLPKTDKNSPRGISSGSEASSPHNPTVHYITHYSIVILLTELNLVCFP